MTTLTVLVALAFTPAQPAMPDIVVGGPVGLRSVQEAVARAPRGGVIHVLAGTYRERMVTVGRPVTIIGMGWPRIEPKGEGTLLHVTADSVVIRGLDLRSVRASHVRDNAAILFDDVIACEASGNRLIGNHFAIMLARAADCRITGNVIEGPGGRESGSGNGVHVWNSQRVTIEGNRVRGQRDGIYLEHVSGALIRRNRSRENLRYGLHFMFSSDNQYEENEFIRNGAGAAVMYSKNVVMIGNTFADNRGTAAYGLLLKEISDSRIERNHIARNTVGISSEGCLRLEVRGNRVERNGWAARVWANSQDNVFSANSFVDNTFDVTTNSRQNFNRFAGNYWSAYRGYDLDRDGVGDVPHRPVRLYALLVEQTPMALALLRSAFVDLLDVAERVAPVLTPQTLIDETPLMREVAW